MRKFLVHASVFLVLFYGSVHIVFGDNLANDPLRPVNVFDMEQNNIIHVGLSGDDANDGSSPTFAKRTIKAAITEANSTATSSAPITVRVGPGVYSEDNPIQITNNYVLLQGESSFTSIIEPQNDGSAVLELSAGAIADAANLEFFKIRGDATFKSTANSVGIKTIGDGRFLIRRVNIESVEMGLQVGNGTILNPLVSQTLFIEGIIKDSQVGAEVNNNAILGGVTVEINMCDQGIVAKDTSTVQVNGGTFWGNPLGISGTGIAIQDTAKVTTRDVVLQYLATGVSISTGTFNSMSNIMKNNITDIAQTSTGTVNYLGGQMNLTKTSFTTPANVKTHTLDESRSSSLFIGKGNQDDFVADVANHTIGMGIGEPVSKVHIYEDTTEVGNAGGLTIENDGDGDSLIQWLLTSLQRWVVGIDNSDGDKFKISSNIDLDSDAHLTIDTTGNVGIGTTNPAEKIEINNTLVHTSEYDNGNGGATPAIDWSNGNYQTVTLDTVSATLSFTDPQGVGDFVLRLLQDGTGGRTIGTWDTDILWEGGVVPSLSTTADAEDLIRCYYNTTKYYCSSFLSF